MNAMLSPSLEDRREAKLLDHAWLSDSMKHAAEGIADELAEVIYKKADWSDADALLMGRMLMDELCRMADVEVRL